VGEGGGGKDFDRSVQKGMSFTGFNRFLKKRVLCFEKKKIIGRVEVSVLMKRG
jgi:hypothetical protein